jgi:hypothetical protein
MSKRDESGERRRTGANGPQNHESLSYPNDDLLMHIQAATAFVDQVHAFPPSILCY